MVKIGKNQERDERQLNALRALKWRTLVLWECAVRTMKKQESHLLVDKIIYWLLHESECTQINEAHLMSECSCNTPKIRRNVFR